MRNILREVVKVKNLLRFKMWPLNFCLDLLGSGGSEFSTHCYDIQLTESRRIRDTISDG